jgi:haloacetate dehalogenase
MILRSMAAATIIPGFSTEIIDAGDAEINVASGGDGPPLLLLHGYPQTHGMWHLVAPALAERFHVVAADLRGYGDSSKPRGDERHQTYAKRTMGGDMAAVMGALGFERFLLAGHDRGARVAHRMALDHPRRVERVAILDIIPTHHLFTTADRAFANAYWHWFFLSQNPPLPEQMIGGAAMDYLHTLLTRWAAKPGAIAPEAVAEYERCWTAESIHASCEDYRAAASIDLEHDDADIATKVACPMLVLWGEFGRMGRLYPVMDTWRARAADVRGTSLPCGHFVAEEDPEGTIRELLAFFS